MYQPLLLIGYPLTKRDAKGAKSSVTRNTRFDRWKDRPVRY